MSSSYRYRKIYEDRCGPIPKDEDGRTFEIHHKDGNRNNNDISNLICVSIKEHYDIHYKNGDYGACVMIAKRMNLPADHISKIQTGCKRPGIGGVKKGTPSKLKGIKRGKINITEDGIKRKIEAVKRNAKISDDMAAKIREDYENQVDINDPRLGMTMRNGKKMTYERLFCIEYGKKFDVSSQYIFRILRKVSKIV